MSVINHRYHDFFCCCSGEGAEDLSWVGQRVYVARESVVAPIALLTVEGIDPGCHQSGVKSVVVARSAVAILKTQVCSISIFNSYLELDS